MKDMRLRRLDLPGVQIVDFAQHGGYKTAVLMALQRYCGLDTGSEHGLIPPNIRFSLGFRTD